MLEESHAQDHGANIFRRRGLEQVGAAAGAVAHVVTHQIGDNGGIARIVLRNSRLDFTHQVRAHICPLGVNPAPELREQRHETGPESETDDLRRDTLRVIQAPVQKEQEPDTEQRHGDHGEA